MLNLLSFRAEPRNLRPPKGRPNANWTGYTVNGMIANKYHDTFPWTGAEVLEPDANGVFNVDTGARPVWDAISESGVPDVTALGLMHKVLILGWPDAMRQLRSRRRGKKRIVRVVADPEIWELKCQPSGWRVYFYVYQTPKEDGKKYILFLHAVDKKRWKEDDSDKRTAVANLGRVRSGAAKPVEFQFPDC